ncbi:MAG: DUF4114 domain-containing protein [Pedobacter sp.]|nr:MAG: DUF4114 domain-containing protein [Pedobacter sp.]
MNKNLLIYSILFLAVSLSSCKKAIEDQELDVIENSAKVAPDNFAYQTTKSIDIDIRLLSRTDQPISGALVSIFEPNSVTVGKELSKVLSDKNGYVRTKINVPANVTELVVDPKYIGLARNVNVFVKFDNVSAIIGGQTGVSGNIVLPKTNSLSNKPSSMSSQFEFKGSMSVGPSTFTTYNPASYGPTGRPLNLEVVDNINFASLMAQVNATLPESEYVASKYIATHVPSDLKVERLSDIWITFIHEGADYRNTLAYYTYPTGNPPLSENDIANAHVIFPNCSTPSSNPDHNGAMVQGDKVKIGRFPAGTSIGFMLLQNAYSGNNLINFASTKFFSTEGINPESNPLLKRHNVVLHNISQRTFLIGFEDIDRSGNWGSDHDFNDLVFYAQSNPVDAISPIGIPLLDESYVDGDGDGIPDAIDEYPTDPLRAYTRYYPSEFVWGTTAFEDNWPNEGDYDLNDLVVSYRYKFAMNSFNQLVDIIGEYKPLAAATGAAKGSVNCAT